MKINKISSKLIKPHTPTPQNLKNHNISFIDQYAGTLYFSVILFYESKPEIQRQLEESLARILVEFYPLAGRYIKNDHMVDCSDQGAEFVEAEALDDVELIDLVAKIETHQLNALLPETCFRIDGAAENPLLSIQATHFPCGGVAIAVSVSHKVFDGSSLGTFVAAWSLEAANPEKKVGLNITPSFNLPSLLPYKDMARGDGPGKSSTHDDDIVVKRFLFDKEALTRLRSNIRANNNGRRVSGVRVVCAVIARALIGLDRAKHKHFVISQPINMRERTVLRPLPKHVCGNFIISSITRRIAASEAEDIGMGELVGIIGDAVRKSIADSAEILSPDRDGRDIIINSFQNLARELSNPDTSVIVFSDWSKFGFYEADFGWGKPMWTSIQPIIRRQFTSTTVFMSNKESDGIEAWVHLSQNDMPYFEQNEEIKLYTA